MNLNVRHLLTVALALALVAPAASAYVAPNSYSGPGVNGANAAPDAGDAGDGSASAAAGGDDSNYTRLYIDDRYRHAQLKPGDSTTFNVTVGNGEDHDVTLSPHVVLPQVEGRPLKMDWVTIEEADTTLAPDEEREFTVTVSIPDGTELGDYSAQVAFTNESIQYPGRPSRPVHAASLNVDVWKEPSVTITGDRWSYAQIQAGESYTFEFVVRNEGDEAVPLKPKLQMDDRHRRYGNERSADRSWFTIDAPSEVAPGENATVTVTVAPPADANLGRYDARLDLGLKDPNRPDDRSYWQEVNLNFQVWQQPEEAFEKEFSVSEDAESVTLTLQAGNPYRMSNPNPVSFDVEFVAPNGTVFDAERVTVKNSGHVSLGESDPGAETQGPYSANGDAREFTYRVDDPSDGTWTVRIMPHNTMDFRYEIVRDESA